MRQNQISRPQGPANRIEAIDFRNAPPFRPHEGCTAGRMLAKPLESATPLSFSRRLTWQISRGDSVSPGLGDFCLQPKPFAVFFVPLPAALAQLVEHHLDMVGVTGSSPVGCIFFRLDQVLFETTPLSSFRALARLATSCSEWAAERVILSRAAPLATVG